MKKILLLFLAAVLTGCGIYLAFYIYGGYREDKEVKDSMKSVELLQSQAVVPKEDAGGGQAPDEPDGNTSSINPGISVDFGVLSDTNPDIMAWLHIPDTYISFPVLQERTLMEYYYLDHDHTGQHNTAGAIKTTYADYGFEFLRRGDAYVLSSVTNTELTGLEKFINPGPYNGVDHKTVIWTNEFWPMDYAPSYGTDGHDPKFGHTNRDIYFLQSNGNYSTKVPAADAMIDHNSYFGFQFEVKFTIPDGYRGPMEYIFFGDDDMWVFLDGKLVCDIGGVHSAVGEYVNLWDYLQKDDSSEHTLSFYWTERGASGSTCWMQFVIPNVNNATQIPQEFAFPFTKTDTEGNPLGGVEFTMYEDDACTIPASVRYSRDTSRNNGRVVFTDLKDGQTYYIKETKPLEGYAPDNSVYVLTQDENKAWFMYKLTDADKTPVDTIVNRPDGLKLPDTGSREAMVLMYIASILLSCSMLAFYIAGRKRGTRHEDK